MRVVFLVRDGTVVKDYADEHWTNIYELEFLPNFLQGLKSIINKGYEIIIITNQYIIHEGYISYSKYKMLNDAMCVKLKSMGIDLLDIFICVLMPEVNHAIAGNPKQSTSPDNLN